MRPRGLAAELLDAVHEQLDLVVARLHLARGAAGLRGAVGSAAPDLAPRSGAVEEVWPQVGALPCLTRSTMHLNTPKTCKMR